MTLTRQLCFLDVETTGIDPVVDRIIEFAVSLLRPDGTSADWCQRFNPGMHIPNSEIHGITDADVDGLIPFSEMAYKILISLRGKDLAGYNLRFDLGILDEELRRCQLKLDLTGVQVIDCYRIFQEKEPRDLAAAVRKYAGREHEGAHGAAADARATLDVFNGQLAMYPDLAEMDLAGLAEFSLGEFKYADIAGKLYYDDAGEVCYGFGNSKGKRIADDPGFGMWILGKNFPASTKDVIVRVLGL